MSWREIVGFELSEPSDTSDKRGASPAEENTSVTSVTTPPNIENPTAVDEAIRHMNEVGARIMRLNDGPVVIGIWRDTDGPELRSALQVLEMGNLPVRFLDEDGIPECYKRRT